MAMKYSMVGLLIALLGATSALAHKVNIFAYVEGDSIHTESYFNDGRKCQNSTVALYDETGELLLEGETDEEGMCVFPIPKREALKVVLNASMGHRNEYLISREEMGLGEGEAAEPVDETAVAAMSASAGSGDLARSVDQVLARRLGPIAESIRRLEKQQEQASLRDVIGGIGYIVGLAGLYYYFRSRSR